MHALRVTLVCTSILGASVYCPERQLRVFQTPMCITTTEALALSGPTITVSGFVGALVLAVLVIVGILLLALRTAQTIYFSLQAWQMLREMLLKD